MAQDLTPCYKTDPKDKNRKVWGYCDRFYAATVIQPNYDTTFAFSEGLGRIRQNGKYGFVDRSGKLVVSAKYEAVDDFHGGFAAVFTNNRVSYINKQGIDVFKKSFKGGRPFNDGLALVFNDEGLVGYLDSKGAMTFPFSFKKAFPFNGGIAPVMGADEKWKAVNRKGETLFLFPDKVKYVMGPFMEGLAPVYVDGPSGYKANYDFVNDKGEFICDVPYTSAQAFKNGRAIVARENKDRNGGMQFLKYGLIKKGGREIVMAQYACLEESSIPGIYYYGKTSSSISNCKGYGLLDSNGKELTPPNYSSFTRLSENSFLCKKVTDLNQYVLLNTSGKELLSQGHYSREFQIVGSDTLVFLWSDYGNGTLSMSLYNIRKGVIYENAYEGITLFEKQKLVLAKNYGKGAVITTGGQRIVDSVEIKTLYSYNQAKSNESVPLILLKKSGSLDYKLFNINTLKYVPANFDFNSKAYDYEVHCSEGMLAVEKGGKWGYIDVAGKLVIPTIYERADDFSDGWAVVQKKGKGDNNYMVYINKAGKEMPGIKADHLNASDFAEGFAFYRKPYLSDGGGDIVYINSAGKTIFKSESTDFFKHGSFRNGLAAVPNKNGLYGYINTKGQLVIPYQFAAPGGNTYMMAFNAEGRAKVEKDGKQLMIDKSGNVIK